MNRFLVFLPMALCLSATAWASTFAAMTTGDLVRQSDSVVEGRVVALESFWNESGRLIVTEATIAVDEVILGSAQSQIAVRVPGGKVADLRVEAHGFPELANGERVLLFLKSSASPGKSEILGYQQGHFRVVERLDGVTLAVPMVEEGARYFLPSGRMLAQPQSVRVDDFKQRLRSIARQAGRPVN